MDEELACEKVRALHDQLEVAMCDLEELNDSMNPEMDEIFAASQALRFTCFHLRQAIYLFAPPPSERYDPPNGDEPGEEE